MNVKTPNVRLKKQAAGQYRWAAPNGDRWTIVRQGRQWIATPYRRAPGSPVTNVIRTWHPTLRSVRYELTQLYLYPEASQ